jgi:flavoprotein
MLVNLFDFDGKNISITKHCYTNWYLKSIIDKYGEQIALKIFTVYQYMCDLNTKTNPYALIDENEKLETIIRAVCPELPLTIDWDDELITEGIDIVRKLYETPSYRAYLAAKSTIDKFSESIKNVNIILTKNDGNAAQIKAAFELYDSVRESSKKIFKEFEAENKQQAPKGGGSFAYDEM